MHASLVVVPALFWAISRSPPARNTQLPAGHDPTPEKLKRSIMITSSHFLHKKVEFQEFSPFKETRNFMFNYLLHPLVLIFYLPGFSFHLSHLEMLLHISCSMLYGKSPLNMYSMGHL